MSYVAKQRNQQDVLELQEGLQRTANMLRLEGDYVAAQKAERQLMNLNLTLHLAIPQQKSAA